MHRGLTACSFSERETIQVLLTQKQPSEVFYKKMFLKISQNSQESTCALVSFLTKLLAKACNFIKETLAQMFSCEFYEIAKNT